MSDTFQLLPTRQLPPKPPSITGSGPIPFDTGSLPASPVGCGTRAADSGERIIELPDQLGPLDDETYFIVDSADEGTRRISSERVRETFGVALVDQELNIETGTLDDFAMVNHNLGTSALVVTLLFYLDNLWTLFAAPWQVIDPYWVRVSFAHGWRNRSRIIIQAQPV